MNRRLRDLAIGVTIATGLIITGGAIPPQVVNASTNTTTQSSMVSSGTFGFEYDSPCTSEKESIPVTGTYRQVNGKLYVEPLKGDGIRAQVIYHPTADNNIRIENIVSWNGLVSRTSFLLMQDGSIQLLQNNCAGK